MQPATGTKATPSHLEANQLQKENDNLKARLDALSCQLQSQRESYNTLKHHAEQVVNSQNSEPVVLRKAIERLSGVVGLQNQAGSLVVSEEEISHTDDALISKGMIPISSILKSSPIESFMKHVGIDSVEYFERWLDMRLKETMKYKSMILAKEGEVPEDHEMFEWAVSHAAVYQEVMVNFKNAVSTKNAHNAH
jgi:hypothetical protein